MLGQYKRGGVSFCLVRLSAVYDTSTGRKGINGQEILLGDEGYTREKRARTYGTVIQIPVMLGNKPLYQVSTGFPGYGPVRMPTDRDANPHDAIYAPPKGKFKFLSDIVPEVEVGDKIYFPWNAVFDKRNLIAEAPDKSSHIFKVNYELIYAAVRDGNIIPIGANILIDPVFESYESILRPTFYAIKDAQGNPVPRPKKEWIQTKVAPSHIEREGIIAHVGTPLKGDKCRLKVGMKVLYKPKLQSLLEIEGKKYFILRQNQILVYK